jgi:hypothetical protein
VALNHEASRALRIQFGRAGDAHTYEGTGWSAPEKGHTWSLGRQSTLVVPCPAFRRRAIFFISVWPHLQTGALTQQRIQIEVNGVPAARLIATREQILAGGIPRQALAGFDTLTIRLRHPDAARPIDFPQGHPTDARCLGVSYRAIRIEEMAPDEAQISVAMRAVLRNPAATRALKTAPELTASAAIRDAAEFLPRFQSLGDDCEFGIFQREVGVEALGLLRFASVALEDVRRGLADGFAGLGDEDQLEIRQVDVPDHDFMAHDASYGMLYHTGRYPGQIDPVVLKAKERQRLRFLARKFIEDAALDDQIFVVKRRDGVAPEEVARLFAALRRRGRSRLIWMREAEGGVAPGTAERLTDGLVAAYVDRFDVAPLKNVDVAGWVAACRAAMLLL